MNIMFLAMSYAPEEVSGAVLVAELAEDLVKRGHNVTVVAPAPNYPYGRIFAGYKNWLYRVEFIRGVRVIRTWSYISPQKTFWRRLFFYGTFSTTAFYGALFAGRPELLVAYLPPLPLGLTAWLLSILGRLPWILQIEDLYPDAAIAAGILTNKKVINFFLWLEKFLYQKVSKISVIANSFRKVILTKGISDTKIEVIPVWADPDQVQPMAKNNAFRAANSIEDEFVVLYAGNIGLTSCLEDVLHAADLLKDQAHIKFVIVGEGVKKEILQTEARSKELTNIIFLPFQPREQFAEMLAAADLSLVTLNSNAAFSSLPSKIFNVMASARPILAISPRESEIASIVQKVGCGVNIDPGSPEKLAETIVRLKMCDHLLSQMGQISRLYLETHYSRSFCVDSHERLYLKLLEQTN